MTLKPFGCSSVCICKMVTSGRWTDKLADSHSIAILLSGAFWIVCVCVCVCLCTCGTSAQTKLHNKNTQNLRVEKTFHRLARTCVWSDACTLHLECKNTGSLRDRQVECAESNATVNIIIVAD